MFHLLKIVVMIYSVFFSHKFLDVNEELKDDEFFIEKISNQYDNSNQYNNSVNFKINSDKLNSLKI